MTAGLVPTVSDIAAVHAALEQRWPGIRFRSRGRRGPRIIIDWVDGPAHKTVEAACAEVGVVDANQCHTFRAFTGPAAVAAAHASDRDDNLVLWLWANDTPPITTRDRIVGKLVTALCNLTPRHLTGTFSTPRDAYDARAVAEVARFAVEATGGLDDDAVTIFTTLLAGTHSTGIDDSTVERLRQAAVDLAAQP